MLVWRAGVFWGFPSTAHPVGLGGMIPALSMFGMMIFKCSWTMRHLFRLSTAWDKQRGAPGFRAYCTGGFRYYTMFWQDNTFGILSEELGFP